MQYGFVLGAALVALLSAPALGDDLDPASSKQLHDYVITMPKVTAFEAGYDALMAAGKTDPSLMADYHAAREEHTKTMADEIAKMTHHPRTYAFFAKQGLSKEDAALLPMALMGGCMVAQYPDAGKSLAAQVSGQQSAFCKQNQAAVNRLKFVRG